MLDQTTSLPQAPNGHQAAPVVADVRYRPAVVHLSDQARVPLLYDDMGEPAGWQREVVGRVLLRDGWLSVQTDDWAGGVKELLLPSSSVALVEFVGE